MRLKPFLFLLTFFSLAGCEQQFDLDRLAPKQEAALAKSLITQMQSRDFQTIESEIDPKLNTPALKPELEKLADMFSKIPPTEIKIVGVNYSSHGSGSSSSSNGTITMQYKYGPPYRYLLISVVMEGAGANVLIKGFSVKPISDSIENLTRFTFKGKGGAHYLMFAVTALVPIIILIALFLCVRTPMPRKKWLWLLFILVGVFKFKFNWNDGSIDFLIHRAGESVTFDFISFELFGSGAVRSGAYGPWILITSIPAGAILFLYKRKQWLTPQSTVLVQHDVKLESLI
jgi:hypothetical protein